MIKYQITEQAYEAKPPRESDLWGKLRWKSVETELNEFYDYIRSNHFVRPNLESTSNGGKRVFVSSSVIFLDYDKGDITMDDFVSSTQVVPSFYYKSHSSNPAGNKFRIGYVLDAPICSPDEYRVYAQALADNNGVLSISDWDQCTFEPTRMYCGAEYGFNSTSAVIPLKKLKEKIPATAFNFSVSVLPTAGHKRADGPHEKRDLTPDEQAIKDAFFQNTNDWFISQHPQPAIERSFPISETDLFSFYDPNNYFEIIKKMTFNGKGMSNYHYDEATDSYKRNYFTDGEHRRSKIAVSLSFIHQIVPDISLVDLLTQELLYIKNNIDNNADSIDKTWIWNTCFEEYTNPRNYPCGRHKKMSVKKGLLGGRHYKSFIKTYRKDYCLSLYDDSLTIKENISVMNNYLYDETGTDVLFINERTLKSYLTEEGIVYTNKPIDEIKRLYKEGLLTMDKLKEYKDVINKNTMTKYKRLLTQR